MAGFKLDVFKGIRPRISSRLLPIGESQTAENVRLGSGSIDQWNGLELIEELCSAGINTIHRMRNDGTPLWLEWEEDVDVARGPVPNDELERTYYTSAEFSEPRMTYTTIADGVGCQPDDYRILGTPAPDNAPDVDGEALPSESITGTMTYGSWNTNYLKADFTIVANLPANLVGWYMGNSGGYDAPGTTKIYDMDFYVGQQIRVASVVDTDTITIEDANGGTYLAADVDPASNTAKQFRTDDTGTSRTGLFRFYVPNGIEIEITGHNLQEGDVIRISAIPSPISIQLVQTTSPQELFYGAESDNGTGTAATNTWPAAPVYHAGDSFYQAGSTAYPFIDVWREDTGPASVASFTLNGGFSFELIERDGVSYNDIATDIESRVYVYTWVSELGEEGPPSPASDTVTIPTGGQVTIDNFQAAPSTQRNITHRRIYRANTGSEDTVFQFVAEITVGTSTYDDTISDLDLGEELQTTTWDPPDEDMVGIIALPNGGMAGFFGKTLCFAEPYYPHAWPPEYRQSVDYDIVGLGILPNGLAVLTKGPAYIAAGDHPRAMSLRHFTDSQSCGSKHSIVSTIDSVIYSSPDGLASVGANGFELLTDKHVQKREWQASFEPSNIEGFWHDGKYFGFHSTGGLVFDPYDESIGLTTIDTIIVTGYLDAEEDTLYLVPVEDLAPMMVAGADSGTATSRVMRSATGTSGWATQTVPSNANSAAAWHTGIFLEENATFFLGSDAGSIAGSAGMIKSADGGVTWEYTGAIRTVHGFAYNSITGRLVAAGSEGGQTVIGFSDDLGVTWDTATWPPSSTATAIAWAAGLSKYYALSAGGGMFESTDAETWVAVSGNEDGFTGLAGRNVLIWSDELDLLVLQLNNSIQTSPDGSTWTQRLSAAGANLEHMAYSPSLPLFVAVYNGSPWVSTSPDGINWTSRTPAEETQWSGVAWSESLGLFVAVARSGTNQVMTSPDGITWTSAAESSAVQWECVVAGGAEPTEDIYEWDADDENKMTSLYKSGKTICPHPLNLGAARIVADAYPVTFRLYNDQGDLVTERSITSDEVIRLPGGYLTSWFEVELEGTEIIRKVHVAETVAELFEG